MGRIVGSQIRESLTSAGYSLVSLSDDGEAILREGDKLELWQANDYFAGYTLEIKGVGYEFIREV